MGAKGHYVWFPNSVLEGRVYFPDVPQDEESQEAAKEAFLEKAAANLDLKLARHIHEAGLPEELQGGKPIAITVVGDILDDDFSVIPGVSPEDESYPELRKHVLESLQQAREGVKQIQAKFESLFDGVDSIGELREHVHDRAIAAALKLAEQGSRRCPCGEDGCPIGQYLRVIWAWRDRERAADPISRRDLIKVLREELQNHHEFLVGHIAGIFAEPLVELFGEGLETVGNELTSLKDRADAIMVLAAGAFAFSVATFLTVANLWRPLGWAVVILVGVAVIVTLVLWPIRFAGALFGARWTAGHKGAHSIWVVGLTCPVCCGRRLRSGLRWLRIFIRCVFQPTDKPDAHGVGPRRHCPACKGRRVNEVLTRSWVAVTVITVLSAMAVALARISATTGARHPLVLASVQMLTVFGLLVVLYLNRQDEIREFLDELYRVMAIDLTRRPW